MDHTKILINTMLMFQKMFHLHEKSLKKRTNNSK